MFSKNNLIHKITSKKSTGFHIESMIADDDEKVVIIDKLSAEYPVSLFDEIINIVSEKVCNKTFEKNAFFKFSKRNDKYFTNSEKRKIKKYLDKYFKRNANILYKHNRTYNKLNNVFNKTIPYVRGKILTIDKFLECGNSRLEKLIEEKRKTKLPLPIVNQENEVKKEVVKPITEVPSMPEINHVSETSTKDTGVALKVENKKITKTKKELTNTDILYKEYRRLNNLIKKITQDLNNANGLDKEIKQKRLISCIKLAKELENVIYNYKQLNNDYKETIINSQNIRKEHALQSVTRYIKSRKNKVTLDNIEEHFTREQLNYFYSLGINVEEIVINNSKTKKRK
ncbi:MAG: hypothetical protein IJ068_02145 [Bacilli bacterium]|nr:hypothetical protein [Bacilli bacterium]